MSKIENAENVRLFALNSNQPLALRLSEKLGLPLSDATITHFADGEISITINESVRGREVYVLQSVSQPVNTNLMELLIMVDALRRASAAKINVIMPYYGYARQDRKARSREPITAKLIANLLEMDQIDRLIAIDFHAPQLQGFFDIPVDHLQAAPILASYFAQSDLDLENTVIVAPDHAGVTLIPASELPTQQNCSRAVVPKRSMALPRMQSYQKALLNGFKTQPLKTWWLPIRSICRQKNGSISWCGCRLLICWPAPLQAFIITNRFTISTTCRKLNRLKTKLKGFSASMLNPF